MKSQFTMQALVRLFRFKHSAWPQLRSGHGYSRSFLHNFFLTILSYVLHIGGFCETYGKSFYYDKKHRQ